ncbi:SUMF1/EgtB/PvdO family nonheme iron enzyme [Rivularia sp. UHCC 0363]|uniref:SUMF1/EgtB/PvdO family nonheme iron enzyme n=1 Tax=Rivularia sp. UHCC 0363 TaxID=3110244 RepID=UPI002B1F4048|nr:SUMF1/EgtB/PvdO family nonheme iron enzyme [Rivularia sp. UHCC 0363]MEA5595700.1 SUMF1/EgtB/PvdO family nonheme iron enzyme [Rivularia sp. UHCC 0363]
MQQTPKWKNFIKWFPTGIGGFATGHFAIHQQWKEAIFSSIVTTGLSLWAKFSTGFMEKLEEGVNERGKKSAEFILKQTDTLPNKLRWKLSGFQDKYYRSLVDKFIKLKTEGFNIGLPLLKLEDVFVPLQVASSIPRNVGGGIPSEIKLSQSTPIEQSDTGREIWNFLTNNNQIAQFRRIAILAPPGSGKTTLLQYITLTYARKQSHKYKAPDFIPVLLRLRDVREQLLKTEPPSLSELIQEEIKRLPSTESLNPPPNWLEKRLKNGKCLVMLDGLDEVAKKSDRTIVSRWVAKQMEAHPRTAFILTSRPHGYENNILSEQVDIVLEVQPFTFAQMKQFIQGWYLQTEITKDKRYTPAVRLTAQEQAEDLIEALLQNPAIRRMASNPLLVTMIATVHHSSNSLPGKRIGLYKEICDVLLGRRVSAKKIDLSLTGEQNQSLLQVLALDLMKRGTQKFTAQESKSLIQEILEKAPSNKLTVEEWLEVIKNDVGLIVEKETGSYEFAHLSFQEYLAAVQVNASNQERILIDNFQNSTWAETIRLYAALSDTTQLIEFALQNRNIASLSLAYDCWKEGKSIELETQTKLENMLESGLKSSEPDIAKMAAQVKLSRRLNNLYDINDNVAIDCTYITYAEYQLFINEQLNLRTNFSSNDAQKPIIDVTYQDALKFCAWLNLNSTFLINNYYYRLPIENEVRSISAREHKQLTCWTIKGSNEENGIRVIKAKILSEYEKLVNYLAAGEWEKASKETAKIMFKAVNQESEGELNISSINKIPCSCISRIDNLWTQYSIGNYSWGVRQNIKNFPNSGNLPFWWLSASKNVKETFDALVAKHITCGIERTSTISFDVVTVNRQGQQIQWQRCQAEYRSEDLKNNTTLDMVVIPGGSFMMGTPKDEKNRMDNESPQHQVTVQSFLMGKYPVTQAQWKAVAALPKINRDLKLEPSKFKGNHLPIEQVSWYDAVEFCDRLSQYTGKQYRLPSEAEWEYACRAGTTTPFHFGETITGELANYNANETYADESKGKYQNKTTTVGQFPPNAFGLYDIHGNVWEWCLDDYHENYEGAPIDGSAWSETENQGDNDNHYQVLRGGSWYVDPAFCRSAFRNDSTSRDVINFPVGFRVVCAVGRTFK